MQTNVAEMGRQVNVYSKYTNEVMAAQKQNIPLSKVFAKVKVSDDGTTYCSYPLVKADAGHIPTDASGKIIFDAGRLKAAQMLAGYHGEEAGIKGAIDQAQDSALSKTAAKAVGPEHAGAM